MAKVDVFHKILEQYWGYTSFRPLQEDIIHSIYEGKDTLGLMPTGGGKSITFQVPTIAMDGICIVITPLIALMKDQVDNLRKRGIKATAVYSGMTRDEIITQLENCIFGGYKFLYVSPERLSSDIFQAKLQAMNVCMLAVDESHCISQWGYDFRPSYLSIATIREQLPGVPVLALTATATPAVADDIQDKLGFKNKNLFKKSFVRKNLAYIIRKSDNKEKELIHILSRVAGCAIVYVRNRKKTKDIAVILQQAGISADFYHAGLTNEQKVERQNRWKNDQCRVIVATNAFGMGIDKPDVRIVIHMDMPSSIEEYYQEAGRAGRDEKKAYAVAICSDNDNAKLKKRISNEFPPLDFISRVYDALGNFYQIAVGFGLDTVHDFSLEDFCIAYKLPILSTHHALKILEMAGYIEYTEEQNNPSRLMFLVSRDELYDYIRENKEIDKVLQIILRSYTGVFSEYAYIDEEQIALRCGITVQRLYEILVSLSKYKVLNYIPHKRTPLIIYTQPREEVRYLRIPRSVYEDRLERNKARIAAVLDYVNDNSKCRSKTLVSYFGEEKAEDCGCCDVCIARRKSPELTEQEVESIRRLILSANITEPVLIDKLVISLPYPTEKSLKAISNLLELDSDHFKLIDNRKIMVIQ